MKKFFAAGAVCSLLFAAAPVFAQDNGAQCTEGQIRCAAMNNACATTVQCDSADKAANKQVSSSQEDDKQKPPPQDNKQFAPSSGDQNRGGDQGFRGDPNQGRGSDQNRRPNDQNRGPEDTRWMGQPGRSPEDFDNQNEQRQKQDEDRQKKDDERMQKQRANDVKRMKKDVSRFSSEMKRMKKDITRQEKSLKKCGLGMPQDVTAALSETDVLLAKAAAGSDFDEIQDVQMDLQEKMQVVRESQMNFGYLQGFCQMMPQAQKQIKKATNDFNRALRSASKNKDLDLSEVKAEFDTELGKMTAMLDSAKQKMATEPEDAMQAMQDFFPGFEDVYNVVGMLDALANSSKGVKSLESQLKRAKKNLATLQKKGKDTAELADAISGLSDAINDVNAVRKQKKFDPEEMMGAFEDAFGALEEMSDALEELGIRNPDYAKNFGPVKSKQFNVPMFQGLPQRQPGPGMGPGGEEFGPGGPGGFPGGGFPGQEMMGPPPGGGFEGGGDDFGPEAKKNSATQVAKR